MTDPYDPFTLDQLRTLAAAVDEGSFSAAGRRLSRVQSAVSTAMINLEESLGVPLWDRSGRKPRLTPQGRVVLAAARRVLAQCDTMRSIVQDLSGKTEGVAALCVDSLFPVNALADLALRFAETYPHVDLRVEVQTMSAVTAKVLSGEATIGVVGPAGLKPGLVRTAISPIRMVAVAAKSHPLASLTVPIPTTAFADFVQIVLSERGGDPASDQAVLSSRTFRVTDLPTKLAMIKKGVGWGNLPEHLCRKDLAAGNLVEVQPAAWGKDDFVLTLSIVHLPNQPLGPAHRWIMSQLATLCERDTVAPAREKKRAR